MKRKKKGNKMRGRKGPNRIKEKEIKGEIRRTINCAKAQLCTWRLTGRNDPFEECKSNS
jgi:hypothetical protein